MGRFSSLGPGPVTRYDASGNDGNGFYYPVTPYAKAVTAEPSGSNIERGTYTPVISYGLWIDRMGICVENTGGAGGVYRLGIHANSTSGRDLPGALVLDAGTIPDLTSTGRLYCDVSATRVPDGLSWWVIVGQGTFAGGDWPELQCSEAGSLPGTSSHWENQGLHQMSGLRTASAHIPGALFANPTIVDAADRPALFMIRAAEPA